MLNMVATFYQFAALPNPVMLQQPLRQYCESMMLHGTILLAPEGINGTLAGKPEAIQAFVKALQHGAVVQPAFERLEVKFSQGDEAHFDRLKIKCKREIITFGRAEADPLRQAGTYVAAADWNTVLDDPAVTVIDTRNGFEVAMGTFAGAVDPKLTSFSQFPEFVAARLDPARDRKVAMFCTGGIRCEKASAYLLAAGFTNVYQLHGGILKYLDVVPAAESRWRGACFVFDRRVALGHGLALTQEVHTNLLDSARGNIAECA